MCEYLGFPHAIITGYHRVVRLNPEFAEKVGIRMEKRDLSACFFPRAVAFIKYLEKMPCSHRSQISKGAGIKLEGMGTLISKIKKRAEKNGLPEPLEKLYIGNAVKHRLREEFCKEFGLKYRPISENAFSKNHVELLRLLREGKIVKTPVLAEKLARAEGTVKYQVSYVNGKCRALGVPPAICYKRPEGYLINHAFASEIGWEKDGEEEFKATLPPKLRELLGLIESESRKGMPPSLEELVTVLDQERSAVESNFYRLGRLCKDNGKPVPEIKRENKPHGYWNSLANVVKEYQEAVKYAPDNEPTLGSLPNSLRAVIGKLGGIVRFREMMRERDKCVKVLDKIAGYTPALLDKPVEKAFPAFAGSVEKYSREHAILLLFQRNSEDAGFMKRLFELKHDEIVGCRKLIAKSAKLEQAASAGVVIDVIKHARRDILPGIVASLNEEPSHIFEKWCRRACLEKDALRIIETSKEASKVLRTFYPE